MKVDKNTKYRDPKTGKLNTVCIDCGAILSRRGCKRCHPCFFKHLSKITKNKPKSMEMIAKISGKNCYNWKGGCRVQHDGYKMLYNKKHPRSHGNGYVFEHILIMESYLGRALKPHEEIHHIDGHKDNNELTNLVLCSNHAKHMQFHRRNERGQWV